MSLIFTVNLSKGSTENNLEHQSSNFIIETSVPNIFLYFVHDDFIICRSSMSTFRPPGDFNHCITEIDHLKSLNSHIIIFNCNL